jgi:hypothetical protein
MVDRNKFKVRRSFKLSMESPAEFQVVDRESAADFEMIDGCCINALFIMRRIQADRDKASRGLILLCRERINCPLCGKAFYRGEASYNFLETVVSGDP